MAVHRSCWLDTKALPRVVVVVHDTVVYQVDPFVWAHVWVCIIRIIDPVGRKAGVHHHPHSLLGEVLEHAVGKSNAGHCFFESPDTAFGIAVVPCRTGCLTSTACEADEKSSGCTLGVVASD